MNVNTFAPKFKVEKTSTPLPGPFSVFLVVKNESYLIPHFLTHYRKLGARSFVIFDDKSDDGTYEFLSKQEDCLIITSDCSFGTVIGAHQNGVPLRFGPWLKLVLPQKFAPNDWVIVVDADEFLILPKGFLSIQELCFTLEERSQFYLTAPMVDFYPAKLKDRNFDRKLTPFEGAPFFDAGPLFDWSTGITPKQLPSGVRYRLLERLASEYPKIIFEIYQSRQINLAKTWKVPFLKNGNGVNRQNDHEIDVQPETTLMGTLAHFKFSPDLDYKITWALESNSYYKSSMEYRFLQAALQHLDDESLICESTRTYENVDSLVSANLSSNEPAVPKEKSEEPVADYWAGRKDSIYLFAARNICDKFSKQPRSVIDIGSNNTPILEWFRGSTAELVSLDIRNPYRANGITSITQDLLSFQSNKKYALVTCFQVLEHVPSPELFAKKLLGLGEILIVSVPYLWQKGACVHHIHDPVNDEKMLAWFGKTPIYRYVATELNGIRRLIVVYQGEIEGAPA